MDLVQFVQLAILVQEMIPSVPLQNANQVMVHQKDRDHQQKTVENVLKAIILLELVMTVLQCVASLVSALIQQDQVMLQQLVQNAPVGFIPLGRITNAYQRIVLLGLVHQRYCT